MPSASSWRNRVRAVVAGNRQSRQPQEHIIGAASAPCIGKQRIHPPRTPIKAGPSSLLRHRTAHRRQSHRSLRRHGFWNHPTFLDVPLVGAIAAGAAITAEQHVEECHASASASHRNRQSVHARGQRRLDDRRGHMRRGLRASCANSTMQRTATLWPRCLTTRPP